MCCFAFSSKDRHMDELPKVAEVESASVPASFLLSEPKFTFELNSLAARQDLLTLAAQQLSFEHENGANLRQQRQRPPKIEGTDLFDKNVCQIYMRLCVNAVANFVALFCMEFDCRRNRA